MNPQNPHDPHSNPRGTPQQPGFPQYPAGPPSNPYGVPQHPAAPAHPGMPQQAGGFPPGHQPPVPNNKLASASLAVSLIAIPLACVSIGFLFAVLGAVFGHMAKRQIRETGERGSGMATAGLVIGYCVAGLLLLLLGAVLFLAMTQP